MPSTLQPNQGPAPDPQRKVVIAKESTATVGSDGKVIQPKEDPTTSRQSAPPPPNPQAKAQELELKQQLGEMARTIGELRKQMEMQQREFQLRLQALRAQAPAGGQGQFAPGAYAQQQQPAPDSPEIDPDQPVTAGQLMEAFSVLPQIINQQVTAQAIRATWPVTPEMEQQILSRFPEATNLQEPDKTRFILNAAESLGLVNQGSEQATLQAAASTPAPRQEAVQPQTGTVPLVEEPSGSIEEPVPEDRAAELMAEYERLREEARTAPYSKQKEIWKKAEEVADELTKLGTGGVGLRDLFDYDWEQ